MCGVMGTSPTEGGLNFSLPLQAMSGQATERDSVSFDYDRDCRKKIDLPDDPMFGCRNCPRTNELNFG